MTQGPGNGVRNRGYATLLLRAGGMALLFLMHAVLGRYLGAQHYGSFSFALMLGAILAKLTSLGWPNALTRFVSEYQEFQRRDLLRGVLRRAHQTVLWVGFATSILLAASAIVLPLKEELRQGLLYTALIAPVGALVSVRRGAFQGLHRPIASVVPDEILLPSVVILGCLWFQPRSVPWAIGLYLSASLLAFGLASLWLVRYTWPKPGERLFSYKTRSWLETALPMAIGGLSFLVLNRTDSIMLGILGDMETVGLYAAANRYAILISVVLGSISIVVVPMLSAAYHGGRSHEFYSLLSSARRWATLGALPLVVVMASFPEVLLGLFGPEFTRGSNLLRILAAGQFISVAAGPVGQGLMMTGYQRIAAWAMTLVALGNIVGNAWAIPAFSAVGAAWVTVASITVLNLVLWICLRQRIPRIHGSDGGVDPT